jgi:hypothetical protein
MDSTVPVWLFLLVYGGAALAMPFLASYAAGQLFRPKVRR